MHHKASHHISEEDAANSQQNLLDTAVGAAHGEQPNNQSRHRNRQISWNTEQTQTRGDTCEFRQRNRGIRNKQSQHGQHGLAHAKLFANKRSEAFTGNAADAGGGFLRHNQQEAHNRHGPQLLKTKLSAGCGIGSHATSVRTCERGNHAWTYGEEQFAPGEVFW